MKPNRLTERELRGIAHEVPQGRRSWDPYYQAVLECLSYRRALRKVRKVMFDEGVDYPAVEAVIDRALGAKR